MRNVFREWQVALEEVGGRAHRVRPLVGEGAAAFSGGERGQELGVVVEHLLEVRHEPLVVDGVARDAATGLVEDAAAHHRT